MQKVTERERMVRRVQEALGSRDAALWWQTPHPDLGGTPPLWMTPPAKRKQLYRVIKTTLVKTSPRSQET
jgi:hypothetical protein